MADQVFHTARAAWKELQKTHRRNQTQVGKDLKSGELPSSSDERGRLVITREDLMAYASAHCTPRGPVVDEAAADEAAKKAENTNRILAAKARREELKADKEEGRLVPREFFEMELAKRLTVLKRDLQGLAETAGPGIIRLVAGEAEKAPELRLHLEELFAEFLDRYARNPEMQVPVGGEK